eukprot:TRINITY_DN18404_c0_g1_i1.p1 TRINITY_DN18404_c0_g1~~TRINITY_DN18404_c0_g1_i1.p1  ORF type:complete len:634 (+),score=190.01 TRINITY_DN18404_c0_g1_i1:233-2134(+)
MALFVVYLRRRGGADPLRGSWAAMNGPMAAPLLPPRPDRGSETPSASPRGDQAALQTLEVIADRETSRGAVLSPVEIILRTVKILTLVVWIVVVIIKRTHQEDVRDAEMLNTTDPDSSTHVDVFLLTQWVLWVVVVACTVGENQRVLRTELMRSYLRGSKDSYTRELKKDMYEYHMAKREGMVDIVDTFFERVRHSLHHNPVKLKIEGIWSYRRYDKTGDAIGAKESAINWKEWPPVGDRYRGEAVEFGDALRRMYYNVDKGYLDMAGCGVVPRPVLAARVQWDDANQSNPVLWRFRSLDTRLKEAQARIASEVQADPDDTVFVASGEEGVSTVLRSLPWHTGDRFLVLGADGGDAFKCVGKFLENQCGVEVVMLPLPVAENKSTPIQHLKVWLKQNRHELPKVAAFSHVLPCGLYLDARALTSALHAASISVIIDGSDALGQYPVRVSDINADWYTASLCNFVPGLPGCGFLVANPLKHGCTGPLTVSYFDKQGYFREFAYYGLRDFSSWLAIIDAFDYVSKVLGGFAAAQAYCQKLRASAAALLEQRLGARMMINAGCTLTFAVPGAAQDGSQTSASANLKFRLMRHGVRVHVFTGAFGSSTPRLYIRATVGVCSSLSDFETLARLLLQND